MVAETLQANPMPATLLEAHELVLRQRPKLDADPSVWAAFHRRSAEIYGRVAKVDGTRRYEAQYYAGREIREARRIEDGLAEAG